MSKSLTRITHYWKALKAFILIVAGVILGSAAAHAVTPPGTSVENTATASFNYLANPATTSSNTVKVTTTIIKTPSSIKLYQFDPAGSGEISLPVPTQYASSGPPGAGFAVSPDPQVPVVGGGVIALDPL
ncbi:MAG TPA: hypothetical protein ENJ64_03155, partial [Thiotrichales bacterium]|nr:hypothetical protein [Thiotrichales bacterium]